MTHTKPKLIFAVSVLLIFFAILYVITSPLLTRIGTGVYQHYFGAWILLILSVALVLYGVLRYKLLWMSVVGFGVLFVNSILVFSYLWGVPQGTDVWTHILYSDPTYLFDLSNPYPAIHAMTLVLTTFLNTSKLLVYTHGIAILSTFGAVASAIVFRSSGLNWRMSQVAYLVSLPMWSFGAVYKPLTLTLPFLLIIIWIYMDESTQKKRYLSVGTIFLIFFHIQIVFLATLLIGTYMTLSAVDYLNNPSRYESKMNFSLYTSTFILFSISMGLYIIIYDPILESVISSIVSTSAGGAEAPAKAGKQSAIRRLLNDPRVMGEAVSRILYGLLLGIISGWAFLRGVISRDIYRWEIAVMFVAGVVLIVGLLTDIILSSYVISSRRIATFMLPIFLVFLTIRAFKQPAIRTFFMTILLVTAGVFGLYESPLKGNVTVQPSEQDIHVVNWVSDHRGSQSVVSTSHLAEIIAGLYPTAILDWSRPEVNTLQTKASLPQWKINDSDSIYLLGARETASIQRVAIEEGDMTGVRNLRNFRNHTHTIYSSGKNTVHRRPSN